MHFVLTLGVMFSAQCSVFKISGFFVALTMKRNWRAQKSAGIKIDRKAVTSAE
jgi:hypothetical protein